VASLQAEIAHLKAQLQGQAQTSSSAAA